MGLPGLPPRSAPSRPRRGSVMLLFVALLVLAEEAATQTRLLKVKIVNVTCVPENFRSDKVVQCLKIGINPRKRDSFHIIFNATREFSVTKLAVKGNQCKKDTKSSCRAVHTLRFSNICPRFHDKLAPWYPLVKSFEPTLSCPVKKGVYEAKSATIDISLLRNLKGFPLLQYPWLAQIFIFNEEELLLAADAFVNFEE